MKRLSSEIKAKLKADFKSGKSINKVSSGTGLAKSTLYYWYKKWMGRKTPLLDFSYGPTELAGEVIGIFAGDGSQYYYKKNWQYEVHVHFGMKNLDYAHYVKMLFEKNFNKIFRLNNQPDNKLRLSTQSKIIFEYFHKFMSFNPSKKHCTVLLKEGVYPVEFAIGFIRGFHDTDGSISQPKYGKPVIMFHTTSGKLAIQIREMLTDLEIETTMFVQKSKWKPMYRVRVRAVSVYRFIEQISSFKCIKFQRKAI
ncbi:hypothetical protein GOV11_00345 [Candidatus Woesearchaeota archaeon]|nr:hypothetical protein [Candidatus Woesearchaeota archaeon]